MHVAPGEPRARQHRLHGFRGVDESAEGPASESGHEVLRPYQCARQQVVRRVAEDQQPSGMAARGGEQSLVVRVAAHHPVQDHDVGPVDITRGLGDVDEASGHAVRQAGARQQASRLLLVASRDLQVRGPGGAATEQLELDLPHASTDLEDAGSLDVVRAHELDDPARRRVESALAIARGHASGETVREDGLVTLAVTTARHGLSMAGVARPPGARPSWSPPCRAPRRVVH